jgi:hypothetical protein
MMSGEVRISVGPDGYYEIELEGKKELRIKFGPGEIEERNLDGEKTVWINVDGLSRLLIEGGVRNKKWPRFIDFAEQQVEGRKGNLTLQQYLRFKEAVAVARADMGGRHG